MTGNRRYVLAGVVAAVFTEAVELLADEVNGTDPAVDAFPGASPDSTDPNQFAELTTRGSVSDDFWARTASKLVARP